VYYLSVKRNKPLFILT